MMLTTANEGSGNGIDADAIVIDSLELGRRVVTTATGTSSDANYWAKIATFSAGTSQYNDGTIILAVTNEEVVLFKRQLFQYSSDLMVLTPIQL